MAHRVNIFRDDTDFDEDGVMRPSAILEVEDGDLAVLMMCQLLTAQGNSHHTSLSVDWRLCSDLPEYLRLTNAKARWCEENPDFGLWVSKLTEDLDHWREYGISTPEQLEKHLMLESYSDIYKSQTGVRPRGAGFSMDTPIEEIESALAALYPSRDENECEVSP